MLIEPILPGGKSATIGLLYSLLRELLETVPKDQTWATTTDILDELEPKLKRWGAVL